MAAVVFLGDALAVAGDKPSFAEQRAAAKARLQQCADRITGLEKMLALWARNRAEAEQACILNGVEDPRDLVMIAFERFGDEKREAMKPEIIAKLPRIDEGERLATPDEIIPCGLHAQKIDKLRAVRADDLFPVRSGPGATYGRVLSVYSTWRDLAEFGERNAIFEQWHQNNYVREICRQDGWSLAEAVPYEFEYRQRAWVPSYRIRDIPVDDQGRRLSVEADFEFKIRKNQIPFKQVVIAGVNRVWREHKRCDQVAPGRVIKDPDSEPPRFIVWCTPKKGLPFKVSFTESYALPPADPMAEDRAVELCMEAARRLVRPWNGWDSFPILSMASE